jgi:hypothetical protein
MGYLATILLHSYCTVCLVCAGLCFSLPAFTQHAPGCTSHDHPVFVKREKVVAGNGETLFIPVIFHVVYSNSEENISNSRIYSQLEVINEDFSRRNADTTNTLEIFRPVAGNPNIQFYLAQDPNAITRTATSHGPFFDDDLHRSENGGKDAHETQHYLNIWVADIATLLGYASSPGTDEFKDGVAVNYRYVGRTLDAIAPYNGGRTLTHEIGHWLGLQHLWGNGDCEVNDGLSDTPPQNEAVGGCSADHTSCGNLNMTQNFMNLADDACMNLFTQGQSELMRHTLLTQRAGAYTTDRLVTGIKDPAEKDNIEIYPNPVSNGKLVIGMNNRQDLRIALTDITGKKMMNKNVRNTDGTTTLDLTEYPEGLYVLSVKTPDRIYNTKIYLSNK